MLVAVQCREEGASEDGVALLSCTGAVWGQGDVCSVTVRQTRTPGVRYKDLLKCDEHLLHRKKIIRIKSKVIDNTDSFLISLGYDYVRSGSSQVRCLAGMHRGSKEF